jgi:hypothetical protein
MTKTKTATVATDGMNKETLAKAIELMRTYVQTYRNKERLRASIANELKAYDEGMKNAEEQLLEIGREHPSVFDKEGNYDLGDGYLHMTNSTVVVMGKKFDAKEFEAAFPDMIDISKALKISPIKKAFLDQDQRKELKQYGINVTTEERLEVKVRSEK